MGLLLEEKVPKADEVGKDKWKINDRRKGKTILRCEDVSRPSPLPTN
jgi:hypothetical protein